MENKEWYQDWHSYLAILCLLFPVPIVGLILMWLVAPWSIKTKRIIAFIYIGIPIIIGLTVFFYLKATALSHGVLDQETGIRTQGGAVDQAADMRRKSDVSNIIMSARSFCAEKGKCASTQLELTDKSFPSYINIIPSDPQTANNYLYRLTSGGNNCEAEATLSTGEKYIVKCFSN